MKKSEWETRKMPLSLRPKSHRKTDLFALLLLVGTSVCAQAGTPDWLRSAAKATVPSYPEKTPAVVLLDETVTTVSPSGEITSFERMAVKVLRASGRGYAVPRVFYDSDTKVSDFKAWTIAADGKEYEMKEKDAIEQRAANGEVYEDVRTKSFNPPALDTGTVVGWEYQQRRRPYILQQQEYFQGTLPVIDARYTLQLPPGWEYSTAWANTAKKEPAVAGGSYTWELTNLPGIDDEDDMPNWRTIAPRMAVNLIPASGSTLQVHTKWEDIGKWYAQLTSDRRQVTPAIQAKANELTAGKTSELDKIRAIAAYMQRDIRYVAIEIGIGGYQPHYASDIFNNHYGDCKDKATLMGALLKAAGIDSYYVSAQTTRGVVNENFPSASSFNHMIIAIPLAPGTPLEGLQSVVDHPTLGKLLIFDPTDQWTQVGYIPWFEQGNFGLLSTPDGGRLLRLPLEKPESNSLKRTASLKLDWYGNLSGNVEEIFSGPEAFYRREQLLAMDPDGRRKWLETYLTHFLAGFKVTSYEIENLNDYDHDLIVEYAFESTNYAKNMGSMAVIRPRVFGTKADDIVDLKDRHYGMELQSPTAQTDDFQITLPDGYTADELPPAVKASSPFGNYTSETKVEGKVLHYRREYELTGVEVPLDHLKDFNAFNGRILMDERSSALFQKGPPPTGNQ